MRRTLSMIALLTAGFLAGFAINPKSTVRHGFSTLGALDSRAAPLA